MNCIQILQSISILIASLVAIYGITAWRREHVGKRRLELAEDTLTLFYEAAEAIRYIRNPVTFGYETEDVNHEEHETYAHFQARKIASVVFNRHNQSQELFNKLHASRYRFMAQIGKEESALFDDIRAIRDDIARSARWLAKLRANDYRHTNEHQARVDKYESVIWESVAEDDPTNLKIANIIENIERTCQPIISGKGTFLREFLNKKLRKGN